MAKRIASLILVLALLLVCIPQPALAAPELRVITVSQTGSIARLNSVEGDRLMAVYVDGYNDILMSGEDLQESTGYMYENDGKKAVFTRGAKTVEVDLSTGEIVPMKGLASLMKQECISAPMKVGDQWYFSSASLLPWLNVTCDVQEGKLVIIPDDYSFWDSWGQLDLGEYEVAYGDLIMEFEWDSKVVKAMNYTNDHAGEKLLEGVRYTDEYDGSVEDYFDILECLLLDSTHSEYLADTYHENAEAGLNFIGIFAGDYGPIITALQVVNDGIYYGCQYAAFTANHADKMELVDTMSLHRGRYTAQLCDAVIMVQNTYSSWWEGILNKYVLNLDKYLVDKIKDKAVSNPIGKAILMAVDVETKEIQKLNDRIDLMAPMINIFWEGKGRYESGGTHYLDIKDRRSHAILSLYAAGENLRTLAAYSDEHEMYSLSNTYERKAEECDRWIKELTAASGSQMNDSICYWEPNGDYDGDKMDYTEKLLDLYEKVSARVPATGGLELVEYAMLVDFMEYQPLIYMNWTLHDGNDDGTQELVFFGEMEMVGQTRLFQYELDVTGRRNLCADTNQQPDDYGINLQDIKLSGDSKQLLQNMDSYFSQRKNFYASQATDLNGDGTQDRVYAIPSSANMWLDGMHVRSYEHGKENPFGSDILVTLVAAEAVKGGVRVRVMRIMPPKDWQWSLDGGVLTIGEAVYTYQAQGADPFYCETPQMPAVDTSDVAVIDLMLMTPDILGSMMTDYEQWTSSDGERIYAEGWFNGAYTEVIFEPMDGVFRATCVDVIFGDEPVKVTKDLDSTASVEEAEQILQPTFSWDLQDSETDGDIFYHFYTDFYYNFDTETAWYTTIRTTTVWEDDHWSDHTFGGISFFYSESVTEEKPDWLLNSYG